MAVRKLSIAVSESIGTVSALLERPKSATGLFVFGHGAGAGMDHPVMSRLAEAFSRNDLATLRYQFPYTEAGRGRPDRPTKLLPTIRAAVETAEELAAGLPLFAGGKSMGGRMTSLAAAAGDLPQISGLIFVGFPLHAPGKPGTERAAHLAKIDVPMLFLQGTRDRLANLDLLRPIVTSLAGRGSLHIVEGGDHSFQMTKRSGRTREEVLDDLAEATAGWIGNLVSTDDASSN